MSDKRVVSVIDHNNFSPEKGIGPNLDRPGNEVSLNATSDLPVFTLKEASDLLRTLPRTFAKYINEIEKREDRKAQRFYGIDAIWEAGLLLRGPMGDFLRMQLYEVTKCLLSRDEVYGIYKESQGLKSRSHGFIMCYKKDHHYLFLICTRYKTPQEIPDSALEPRFRKGFDASGVLRKSSKFYPIAVDHFRTRLLVHVSVYNAFRQLCYLKVRERLSGDHFFQLLQEAPKIF